MARVNDYLKSVARAIHMAGERFSEREFSSKSGGNRNN